MPRGEVRTARGVSRRELETYASSGLLANETRGGRWKKVTPHLVTLVLPGILTRPAVTAQSCAG